MFIAGVVVVAIAGGPKLLDGVESAFGGLAGSNREYVVAPDAAVLVKQCDTDQILNSRKCGDTKIVVLDAAKMPFIARNIQLAWNEGKPFVLHKDAPGNDQAKRDTACGPRVFKAQYDQGSCDEYPFASSVEGGQGARTEEVPLREQNCQGGSLRAAYRKAGIAQGDAFLVVIANPGSIASGAYAGVDIAKDQSCTS